MKALLLSLFIITISHLPAKAVSHFDLTFNLGPSLNQSGSIKDLGDPNVSTGIGFNYFFKDSHGFGFSYNNESSFEGSKKFPAINDASISTFDIHYSYRWINKKFHLVFEPGFGVQTIYDESNDYYWGYYYYDDLSTSWIFNYKIFGRYMITEWDPGDGTMSNNFFLGAGIIQHFSFNDDYNGRDISGNRLAALFQIGIGW